MGVVPQNPVNPPEAPAAPATKRPDTEPSVPICCPDCDYDLTGLPENRCPECGREFDRERLARWSGEQNLPLSSGPTDKNAKPLWRRTFFAPASVGRSLPAMPTSGDIFVYRLFVWWLTVIAFLIVVIATAVQAGNLGPVIILFFAPLPLLLPSALCETAIAALLARFVRARSVPEHAQFRFWQTLCRCFCTYLPLSTLVVGSAAVLLTGAPPPRARPGVRLVFPNPAVVGFPAALMLLLWWNALARAIRARGERSAGRQIVVAMIPAIGVLAIGLGVLLTAGEVLMLF